MDQAPAGKLYFYLQKLLTLNFVIFLRNDIIYITHLLIFIYYLYKY